MKLHANAALSLKGRQQLCRRVLEEGSTVTEAAEAAEVSVRCARKWVGRYRADGELGLLDRSSAPGSIPHRTSERRVQAIAALRRLRFTGPEIAEVLGMAVSTVSGILTRIGIGELGRVGLEPAQRYERARPGELIHIDIKKLGRIERGAGARVVGMANRASRPRRRDAAGVDRQIAGWAYGAIYRNSTERAAALDGWLWYYNHQRRHSALGHKPPIARLTERTNLLGPYTYAEPAPLGLNAEALRLSAGRASRRTRGR